MLSLQHLKGMQNKYHLFLYFLLLKQEVIVGGGGWTQHQTKPKLEATNPF